MQHSNGNGTAHQHHSDPVVDRLVAAGFMQDADRDNHGVVDAALEALLDRFTAIQPGGPIISFTPRLSSN
jgi:hypothetical protein